ncbi:MAG: cupin-like domain-containing protein [Byssovorax sp.]
MSKIPFSTRLGYELLWISRMLARREDLFFDAEMRLETTMLAELEQLMEGRKSEDREPVPVIQAADFRPDTFNRLYKDRSPVVIRGLGKDTRAARTWSPDFFADKYGDTLVEVRDSPRERVGSTASYNAADFVKVPLGDYIRGMRTGDSQVYLGAMSELFGHHPELMDELEIDALNKQVGVKVIRPEIFMGQPKNHTPWHCAGIDNYFLQVHGQKEWHFINPAYTAGLYLKASAMVFGAPGLFSNVIPGDDRLFPLFKKTPQLTATLEPGDFLYNPAYWWHEVANLGETIGCALRVVAEGGFGHFLVLDKFLLATSFLNPAMLRSNIHMTLNHFLPSRRRDKLFISDVGPRLTVPIKGRKGPSYVEARSERIERRLAAHPAEFPITHPDGGARRHETSSRSAPPHRLVLRGAVLRAARRRGPDHRLHGRGEGALPHRRGDSGSPRRALPAPRRPPRPRRPRRGRDPALPLPRLPLRAGRRLRGRLRRKAPGQAAGREPPPAREARPLACLSPPVRPCPGLGDPRPRPGRLLALLHAPLPPARPPAGDDGEQR